jgi:uncharacterized protein (DUF362 family)
MNKVYIVKGENPYKATKELLDKMNFSLKDKKVFIKTNVHPGKIPSTDVNVVRAIIEKLKNCDITIGGNVGILGKPFIINGYDKLAKEFNVKLLDLEKDEKVIVKVKNPLRFKEFPIAKSVVDADYVINAAKLKIHHSAKVTLCLKNLFGCISGRTKLLIHSHINEAIYDYMQILRSDLNIIDGIIGNQNDEFFSIPIRSNIVIGGYDPLSIDIVGTKCMGIEPEEVEYLKLLNYKEREVKVIGEKIENVMKKYDRRRRPIRTIRNFVEKGLRTAVKLNLISK